MAASEAFISSLMGVSDAGPSEFQPTASEGDGVSEAPAEQQASASAEAADQGNTEPAPAAQKPTAEQLYQQSMAANREVRAENKALKQQLSELSSKIEALTTPAKTQAAVEAQQEPDFLADPKAYVDAAKKDLKALTEKLEANEKQQTEQQNAQQQARETWNKVIASEQEFAQATPDYHDALAHVRTVRTQQLQMMHPDATPQQIAQHIQAEEFQGAAALVAQGKNPSEFYYNYAKTFGYKPKAATPAPVTNQQQRPDKDAVRTMGSGGGEGAPVADTGNDPFPELAAARSERFKPRQRR